MGDAPQLFNFHPECCRKKNVSHLFGGDKEGCDVLGVKTSERHSRMRFNMFCAAALPIVDGSYFDEDKK